MEKKQKYAILIKVLLLIITKSFCQSSCSTGQSLVGYTNGSNLTQNILNKWYYFTASTSDMFVDILKSDTTFSCVDSIFAYSGSCGSLSQIGNFGRIGNVSDSIIGMELRLQNLSVSNTYYLRVKLRSPTSYTVGYKFNLHDASATACNLITNGDFENLGFGCPSYYGCIPGNYSAPSWFSGGQGPAVIYNPCNTINWSTALGPPHSGNTMAGISTSDVGGNPWGTINNHQYFRTTFPALTNGKNYYVQMFYMFSHNRRHATDGLGIYISAGPPTINSNTLCSIPIAPQITPQVSNPANNLMTNLNWLPMGVVIQGTGTENHLTFGNFKPASQTLLSQVNTTGFGGNYYFIDDVSITPLELSITTPPTICTGMSVQLNPVICNPPYCTSTYTWITPSALSNSNISNPYASPSVTTTYTLTQVIKNALNTTVATLTAQVTVSVTSPSFTFEPTATLLTICTNSSQSSTTLSANYSNSPSFTWQPGNLSGIPKIVSPTSTTIYTLSASLGLCVLSKTIGISVSSVCCSSTVTPFGGIYFTASSFVTTPYVFNNDIVIPPNVTTSFMNAEFLFAPNVKITVKPGGALAIISSHLYGCSTSMWQGIVVEDGGRVEMFTNGAGYQDNLFEDAIVGIDATNHTTSTLTAPTGIIDVSYTTFNRNYVAINIYNYKRIQTPYPFDIHDNVFTSRTITFTPTSWPKCTNLGSDMRAVSGSTNGLASPYPLMGFASSNAKSPHNSEPSYTGIRLIDVGLTSGGTYYSIKIGKTDNLEDYNIFDNMHHGIEAVNSNLISVNNIFQKTHEHVVYPPGPAQPIVYGGNGIRSDVGTDFNSKLDLYNGNTNYSLGNRFYDCHYAINCDKTYMIDCRYATFRSTQSYTNTAFGPGDHGLISRTNRFSYIFSNNHVANINLPINISLSPSTYSFTSSGYGIYADRLLIEKNYFGAQITPTTAINGQYINWTMQLSGPITTTFAIGNYNCSVLTNTLDRVYTGIYINNIGKSNFAVNTSSNNIFLVDNNVSANPYTYGILYSLNTGGVIKHNTITATTYTSSTDYSLGYWGEGSSSTSVTCNTMSKLFQAFTFSGNNSSNVWKGNTMITHSRGLVLVNNGIINTQGSSGNPTDNAWNGSWTGVNGTMLDVTSNAANSKLYVRTGSPWQPTNNTGGGAPGTWYSALGNTISTSGSYNCAGGPPPGGKMASDSSSSKEDFFTKFERPELTAEMKYMEDYSKYKFIMESSTEDDLKNEDKDYNGSLKVSSIGKIAEIDSKLNNGDFANAGLILASISPTNMVEQNYRAFYEIYLKHNTDKLSEKDYDDLSAIANLCPGTDGLVVYQARALRNIIYKQGYVYANTCPEEKSALREATGSNSSLKNFDLDIYPNPNSGSFSIVSKTEKENLTLSIVEVGGRLVYNANILTENFVSLLNINLDNGVYFVKIKNSSNETITKKMVISK